ncbi:MAG TPA: hypothetical protein VH374_00990 [Polyangia bacterium]|nr:hypothetical protein [Polyangia bacterium]
MNACLGFGCFCRRAVPTVFLSLGLLLASTAAAPAAPPVDLSARPFDRHAVLLQPVDKPFGVPASYVFTRNGFFHPSCVIKLRADESIDNDGVISDLGGVVRDRVAPCAYPRFDRAGHMLGASSSAPSPSSHTYDGWMTWYDYTSAISFDSGLTVSTDWLVPKAPVTVVKQDIAFFNSVETQTGNADPGIVQPVLEFYAPGKRWWVISEYCCAPMDVQTDPVDVGVGDTIRGTIAGTGCVSGGCQTWTITTTDLSTGKSTVLHKTGLPKVVEIDPGVLETYDITSCDMLPANGQTTFYNHQVTDSTGRPLTYVYRLHTFPKSTPAELPRTCGWGGSSAGSDQYTLTYGTTPTEVDAGALADSGAIDSAGMRDAGAPAADASVAKDATTTPPSGTGGGGSMVGPGGSGGASGSGGGSVSPTGSGGAVGGIVGADAGADGSPTAGAVGSDGGCSCRLVSTDGAGGAGRLLVVAGLLATLLLRRRPRRR